MVSGVLHHMLRRLRQRQFPSNRKVVEMNKYEKMFAPDALKAPARLKSKSAFKVGKSFSAPVECFNQFCCTPVENQGALPWCAAYSAANYAEEKLWRRKGYPEQIDPAPLYKYAKSIDGDPDGDGTYLECTLEALVKKGFFGEECKIKTIGGGLFGNGSALNDEKNAIFRHGTIIAGFNISSEWFTPANGVIRGKVNDEQGGHAVHLVGYDDGGILIQNSWGADYGKGGFVYLTNNAFLSQFMYAAMLTNTLNGLN